MALVYITRHIPDIGINLLRAAGHTVDISEKEGVLTEKELLSALAAKPYDAVVSLLTDSINKDVFAAVPTAKIFANYAVGYNNISLPDATEAGVTITNTPGVLTDTVAEFAMALILSVAKRIPEADRFTRAGKYDGWAPELFLGSDLKGKTLGILGAGRIGYEVAMRAHHGFGMHVIYNDIKRGEELEKQTKATFKETTEDVLREADVVSIHVPLLPSTKHLINAERLSLMKKNAYLINTSRGPVIDEVALVDALKNGVIRGAGLDVFENEPALAKGLASLENVVITAHIASASEETRNKMSEIAAQNVIDFLNGETPENAVKQ
ncbi:MAG: D-glycerate dehydrogenase [Candidatus Pacebacteria bacterium]|nr:D-glycerate dehydrogenase [Candidatus Paceibacterota bacterium]MCF7856982.1 D-glycerate dehydrogenase [Candidatus Paceibacterota bacterium]